MPIVKIVAIRTTLRRPSRPCRKVRHPYILSEVDWQLAETSTRTMPLEPGGSVATSGGRISLHSAPGLTR
jgi:hypothetical protein